MVTKLIGGKALTPDEGRKMLGYGKTGGGDTLWGQHQDHPLGMLAKRTDLLENAPPTEPVEPSDDEARKALARLRDELDSQIAALPVIGRSQTDRMRELATAH